MHNSGFRHLITVEQEPHACETLRANIAQSFTPEQAVTFDSPWPLVEDDIRQVSFMEWRGDVDVVAGGVPCLPQSLEGVHRGTITRGTCGLICFE
ncbi:DNA cytosine methyltransferase [Saccharopolyspora shandongensis]|uniref:DNA cytosine methyltransferase n=1 Tax=Saccharopolyspora shandongensis TaxID=418495 RepID=UPI0033D98518